jgi:hypothetical protein
MAIKESKEMMVVFEKAHTDTKFAKDLFMNPESTCVAAGIKLNRTEMRLLGESMNHARTYFLERIFLLAYAQPSRGDNYFCISCES